MTQQAAQPTIVKYPRALVVDAVVNPTALAAPVQNGALLTIPQDSDFEWWWIALFRTSAQMKINIQEAATTRYFFYNQSGQSGAAGFQGIFVDLWAGLVSNNGAFPQAIPYVMPAARQYPHTFTDLSGAANTVELAYHGYALLQLGS